MKIQKILVTFSSAILVIAGLISFIPISNSTLENSVKLKGEILEFKEEGGPNDVFVYVKNDSHRYYINRGMEKGLIPNDLNKRFAYKEITIHYAKHWTFLDPFGKNRHITRLTKNETVIYNEIAEQ